MALASKTFRIFVSSTFSDLKEERNALQKHVFPRLRELCRQHLCRFQAIDLRWGVSEEAGLDQQTMKICLDEIARCQKVTPRPNFVVLLGDRYGWQPLPAEIPASEFEEIERRIPSASEKALLTQWYQRDDNALYKRDENSPPEAVYCLQPRTGEFAEYTVWEERVEQPLRALLLQATAGMALAPQQRLKYVASATEQEILHGALQVKDAEEHVFCFFRKLKTKNNRPLPEDLPPDGAAKDFVDLVKRDGRHELDQEAYRLLKQLKEEKLRGGLRVNVHDYDAEWTGSGITTNHIGTLPESLEDCLGLNQDEQAPHTLCVDVWKRLSRVILNEISGLEKVDPLDKEVADHETFREDRARFFTGRTAILKRIGDYVKGSDRHPLPVYGASGSGKSAVMARAVQEARKNHPSAELIQRFIGATPSSSDIRALLESLCRQISRRYGSDETAVPTDYKELVQDFPKRLALATAAKPLILFLDALDQLSDAEHGRNLIWLPGELPEHARFVVSTLDPGECLAALKRKLPQESLARLEPMPATEGRDLLKLWLKEAGRTLQGRQRDEVLNKFEADGLPLYLKLAFEEARRWKSYTPPADLSPNVPRIIQQLFARLALPANHGDVMVQRSLGYLAAGKNGLSEDELLDVLSLDAEVMADFQLRSPKSPQVDKLPVVVWSRLYLDLEPYLTERVADGTSLLTFYHRQLREAAEAEFLSGAGKVARHAQLASYFAGQALLDAAKQMPNLRKLSELPYQQAFGKRWDDLRATLSDFAFLEGKCTHTAVTRSGSGPSARTVHGGVFELQEDVRRARAVSPAEHREHWEGWLAFLLEQAHVLTGEPGLVFQQAANEADAMPAARAARKWIEAGRQKQPWLRWVNKRLSPSTCEMTLSGHTNHVKLCAYSPDGSRIVSGSDDSTLRVWDAATGALLATLAGHTGPITGGAFLTGSLNFVSASRDWTLRLWDTGSGAVKRTFSGHRDAVHACAVSRDGRRLVSASQDKTLRIWDVATGETIASLVGHTIPAWKCDFSPDGSRIVSAGWDGCVKVWDARTGAEIGSLKLGFQPVVSCAFSPDGLRVAAGTVGGKLVVYDPGAGTEPVTFQGHTGVVRRCVFPGDGSSLVSASTDRTVRVWDARTGAQLQSLEGHTDAVFELALSPDERLAVSASADASLVVWNLQDGKVVTRLLGHTAAVLACAFSPDGARIVSASEDDTLRVWHYGEFGLTVTTQRHRAGPINACAYAPDGARALTAAADGTLMLWDGIGGDEQATLEGHTRSVTACAYSRSGQRIVSASGDETLRVWDAQSGRPVATISGHTHEAMDCAFSPSGDHVASASKDRTVRVADARTGATLHVLSGHEGIVGACAYSPDGAAILSASNDRTLRLWDAHSGRHTLTLEGHRAEVRAAAFSPDGRLIASGSADGIVRVWEAGSGALIRELTGHTAPIHRCTFSPDGTRLMAEAGPSGVCIWDAATWDVMAALGEGARESYQAIYDALFQRDHKTREGIARAAEVTTRFRRADRHRALASAWSPDGKLVAWSAGDKRVMVWDLQEARHVFSFHAQAPVTALAWSPDGQRLILGGEWGGVQLLWLEGRGGATTSSAWDLIKDLELAMMTAQSADLLNKGLEQHRKGNLSGAMDFFKQAEMACRGLANKDSLAATLGNQAVILQAQGDLAGAMKLLKEQEQLCRETGKQDQLSMSLERQALVLRHEWEVRYLQYMQDLAAWKALPLLKRLRTKKPEPPPR